MMSNEPHLSSVNPTVAEQILRFLVVGGIATITHYVILVALVELTGMRPVLATSIGYAVGVVTSFVLNRKYTFRNQSSVARTFAKYCLVYVIGMGLNAALMVTVMAQGVPYLIAQIVATALVLVWSFLGSRFVVFR